MRRYSYPSKFKLLSYVFGVFSLYSLNSIGFAMDAATANQMASSIVQNLTFDQKLQLTHGSPGCTFDGTLNGWDGTIAGIPGVMPDLRPTDGPAGVRRNGCPGNPNYNQPSTTQLPAPIAMSASFDPTVATDYGNVIGKETRNIGYQWILGGGVNLMRDPRGGRTFEGLGEDPVLAGQMIAQQIKAIQNNSVIATLKHFAINDQESDRFLTNSIISERAMRESDLLAFEIGLKESNALSVMCSYNLINGTYGCSNSHLMNDILKGEWGFQGMVHADYFFATHAVTDANAGLDVDEPGISLIPFFTPFILSTDPSFMFTLGPAVQNNIVPMSRLDDMVHRLLFTMIMTNNLSNPPVAQAVDQNYGNTIAQRVAEQGTVLLKNNNNILPLDPTKLHSIAVIGSHADSAVLSGGGSARVTPVGGFAPIMLSTNYYPYNFGVFLNPVGAEAWTPSSPVNAIKALAPNVAVNYDSGLDLSRASTLAGNADVAIVFVHSWQGESFDSITLNAASGFLGLPCSAVTSDCVDQDQLVAQVAKANPNTVVVIESGSAILMPWINQVNAILEAWYPGIKGGDAIANLLFGKVNPSGKLPITFPLSESDLPRTLSPALVTTSSPCPMSPYFPLPLPLCYVGMDVNYNIEGQNVGYKWFEMNNTPVLFPFGYGLSYTNFSYSQPQVGPNSSDGTQPINISFTLTNTGKVAGAEVAQVYVGLPDTSEAPKRFVGSQKVFLQPGASQTVNITINPNSPEHPLSVWDPTAGWSVINGNYKIYVGTNAEKSALTQVIKISH